MYVLSDQVEVTKQWVMSHIPWNLVDKVLYDAVLCGICKAICLKKLAWSPVVDKRKYMREMYALTKFSNILVNSRTRYTAPTCKFVISCFVQPEGVK